MGYDDNYSPFTAVIQPPRKTRTHLWRVTKGEQRADASLLLSEDGTAEVQIFSDGDIFRGRRCASRALAQQYAAKLLDQYRQRGWTVIGEG